MILQKWKLHHVLTVAMDQNSLLEVQEWERRKEAIWEWLRKLAEEKDFQWSWKGDLSLEKLKKVYGYF